MDQDSLSECHEEVEFLRTLLAKYIRHVEDNEGTDFIRFRDPWWLDKEWATLQKARATSTLI